MQTTLMSSSLAEELANFVYTGPDSKYFRFYTLYGLFYTAHHSLVGCKAAINST
jgi:hypothetical protein